MLLLDEAVRETLWRRLAEILEEHTKRITGHRVAPVLDPAELRRMLSGFDFVAPRDPLEMLDWAAENLSRHLVHPPHPRYFGLFNPAPTTMGIAADALVAAFNPNVAAWSHSPLAVEIEQHLIRAFGERFGYDAALTDGTFTSGGAEANHTAMCAALTAAFPEFPQSGVRALPGQPVCYASGESHHSFAKAARLCGIGQQALREVPVDESLRMRTAALRGMIAEDRASGRLPFLVAATAGTTNAGVLDPLAELADLAGAERLWYHVDAAWGGGAAFCATLKPVLRGIERADSITFDAHKWFSAPMGAGVFLTRHTDILHRTFRTLTAYMPKEAAGLDVVDPHLHSMQWSRRFIGLKVFLSLAVAGWDGFDRSILRMAELGDLLRVELQKRSWEILNETPLPVVCFVDRAGADAEKMVRAVVSSGEAWISTTRLPGASGTSRVALRACITNYRTTENDLLALVESLEKARR